MKSEFYGDDDEDGGGHHDDTPDEIPSLTQNISKSMKRVRERVKNALMPESQKALNQVKQIPVTTKPQLTTKGMYRPQHMSSKSWVVCVHI